MGSGVRFRVGIALSAIGEGLREAARDFGGASLRCVCLPLSPAGSGHPPHRFITPSRRPAASSLLIVGMVVDAPLRVTHSLCLATSTIGLNTATGAHSLPLPLQSSI